MKFNYYLLTEHKWIKISNKLFIVNHTKQQFDKSQESVLFNEMGLKFDFYAPAIRRMVEGH